MVPEPKHGWRGLLWSFLASHLCFDTRGTSLGWEQDASVGIGQQGNLVILFLARHVPGADNRVPDNILHKQMERFLQLAPEADLQPA